MNKNLLCKSILIASLSVFVFNSCVDSMYDLEKEIDDEINFGGSLAIPIGTTQKNTLKKVIETEMGSDIIKLQADGSYALVFNDQMNFDMPQIPSITIDLTTAYIKPTQLNFTVPPTPAGGLTKALTYLMPSAQFDSSTPFAINEVIPSEIASVSSVSFGDDSDIAVEIEIIGDKGGVETMKFNNVRVVFPDFVKFVGSTPTNEVVINDEFDVNIKYVKSVTIDKLKFASDPLSSSHKIEIDDQIQLIGEVSISKISGHAIPSGLSVEATIKMGSKAVKIFEGKVNVDPIIVNENIVLNDVPDFLQGSDVVLDVKPIIMFEAGNSIGIPINVDMDYMSVINGVDVPGSHNKLALNIAPAEIPGVAKASKFWISGSDKGMADGYSFVDAPNLGNLFMRVPNVVKVDVNAQFDQIQNHIIDLTMSNYQVNMRYDVKVPLSFGGQLSMVYRDTMALNFDSAISDYISTAELRAKVTNTIPLNLKLKAIPSDNVGRPVDGVYFETVGEILAGKGVSVPMVSDIQIKINESVKGAFNRVENIILEVSATNDAAVQDIPLTEDQYFQMDMTLRLPKGINVNNKSK